MSRRREKYFTHAQLVEIMANKANTLFGCGLVLKEPKSLKLPFIPDVFAVKKCGITFQFEIKVSMKDFYKDLGKPHRVSPDRDVGLYRYYVMPLNIAPRILPKLNTVDTGKWGVIGVDRGGQLHFIFGPNPRKALKKFSEPELLESWSNPRDAMAEMEFVYCNHMRLVYRSRESDIQVLSIAENISSATNELVEKFKVLR